MKAMKDNILYLSKASTTSSGATTADSSPLLPVCRMEISASCKRSTCDSLNTPALSYNKETNRRELAQKQRTKITGMSSDGNNWLYDSTLLVYSCAAYTRGVHFLIAGLKPAFAKRSFHCLLLQLDCFGEYQRAKRVRFARTNQWHQRASPSGIKINTLLYEHMEC